MCLPPCLSVSQSVGTGFRERDGQEAFAKRMKTQASERIELRCAELGLCI